MNTPAPMGAYIDWTNAVFVPLVLSVLVGFPLAIYTGLVASRVFAFFQARYRTLTWYFSLGDFFNEEFEGPHDFVWRLSQHTHPIVLELKALGHENAAAQVGDIFRSLIGAGAHVLNIQGPDDAMPHYPNEAPPIVMQMLILAMRQQCSGSNMQKAVESLAGSKPNLMPIITLHPFPNYLTYKGMLIGMLIRRRTRLGALMDYLNGVSEGWSVEQNPRR